MNFIGVILFCSCALGLLTLPRRWAPVPLLIGCCYITTGQGLVLGSFVLPVYRLLLLTASIRILLRGERLPGGITTADRVMLLWCVWTLFASFFQPYVPGSGPKYVTGAVFNVAATFFVLRILFHDLDDVRRVFKVLGFILVPVAAAMMYELVSNQNLFSIFGRVPEVPLIRDGRIRAQGPFSHPILAGTIGATCFPLIVAIWSRHRLAALIGGSACVLMVFASASSGPIMSLLFGIFALGLWRYRQHCGRLRIAAVIAYLVLMVVMQKPPYYLIARINLTGSSTGWHRAVLIERTIGHFGEWALFGTNQTRHWMPNQGSISENHTDITNYYISFAVLGGFLCLALMIAVLWRAFKSVGDYVRHPATSPPDSFAVWCLGAAMFAHAASSLSIAYFGQTPVFFWLPVAIVSSMWAGVARLKVTAPDDTSPARPLPRSRRVPSRFILHTPARPASPSP